MKGFILLIIIVIAVLIVGVGAAAFNFINNSGLDVNDIDSDAINDVLDKVNDGINSHNTGSSDQSDKSNSDDNGDSDVVSEEVKFNHQNGEGYYREVTYKDGGFRQYDVDSGKLIGSSYDSDQKKLPSME
ncbi:MAG: DUF3139 domain-containing protein [Methanobrevibacter thaueri]|nr:DUF3139 domain-containing protein [Methanobrevibacter thaueri]